MSDIKARFDAAVEYVKNATGDFKPSQDLQLEMYGLFKQANSGDVHGKKPGLTDFVGKAKYKSWEKYKGISKEEAMEKYVSKMETLKNKHS